MTTKILLIAINAKYIHSNPAIYSLKACLGVYKDYVTLCEYTINNQKDNILQDIYTKNPSVVCFSCYIWNIEYVLSIAKEYRKLCPDIPIWLGGPEVSFETESFLKDNPFITGVMVGEGEETFKELCECYITGDFECSTENCGHLSKTSDICENRSDNGCNEKCNNSQNTGNAIKNNYKLLKNIKGIVFCECGGAGRGSLTDDESKIAVKKNSVIARESGIEVNGDNPTKELYTNIIRTAPRPLTDLDSIPFLYDDINAFKNRIIYYESSRGCPFACSYCLSSVDKVLRFRGLEKVKNELLFFLNNKVPQVKFIDRTFNCDHSRTYEIWEFIRDNDNGITNFHFEVSADILNDKEIELISTMRPGLIQLEIGVQSVNPDTIKEIRRTMDIPQLKKSVSTIRKSGNVHQHLDLIAGLPFEGYNSFRDSFDDIYALWPDQLQLGFLKVLKGSYMYDKADDYKLIYHDDPPYEVLSTKWLGYNELIKIKAVEEMLEVYYNSAQYEITMKLIYGFASSMFDFFLQLGEYYKNNGYYGMNHSRIKRCEILIEFIEAGETGWLKNIKDAKDNDRNYKGNKTNKPEINIDMIKEALVFDLYYRENCKTRPEWAIDASALKEMTRRYCKNGKLSHVEPFHYVFPYERDWEVQKLPERCEEPVWVLFHYDRRNPLDNQAEIELVFPGEE